MAKDSVVVSIVGLMIVFAPIIVFAQSMPGEHQQEAMDDEELIEVGNKICPVTDEKIIEGEAYQVTYEGKIYNLCCKMCAKDFKKNPKKYIEKLEALEALEESEQGHHQGHPHQH